MEPEVSLLYWQESAAGLYPEPSESTHSLPPYFFLRPTRIFILKFCLCAGSASSLSPLDFPTKLLYVFFSLFLLFFFSSSLLSACYLILAGFLFGLWFDPENGSNMFIRNVGYFSTDYTTLYFRR
jgi:hypothetical protein